MAPIVSAPLRAPRLATPLPGPKAAALIARDDQVMSPSYTRAYPLVVARGEGATIEDVDGNLFLDFTAGIAVTATGHSHPAVVQAICEQAQNLIHMSGTDFYYSPEIHLAERLARLAPVSDPKRVFFTNSGAEAIEAALKLARYFTGRQRIIAMTGAFHGRTCGALSLCGSKAVHSAGFGPLLAGVHRLPFDCSAREVDDLLGREAPAREVAAIFFEPVQGEGGYRVPSAGFVRLLRETCDRHGMLLVADEIQSGIGRTGRMFAVDHFGVAPDIVCLAKGLASGMPLGAIVARADLMTWPPGSHASTFGGNPVCCRAALATLDLVEQSFMANAEARGRQLLTALRSLAAEFPILTGARGLGLMIAIDVVGPHGPDAARREELIQAAFHKGLLLLGCGKSAIRFCPALCVTEEQVATAVDILRSVLSSFASPG